MSELKKEFLSKVRELTRRHNAYTVFADFCEFSALAIANALLFDQAREDRYLSGIKKYDKKEATLIGQLLGITTMALEEQMQDFLGSVFMELEISNKNLGQTFTPYDLCRMMAQINIDKELFEKQEFVTLQEPAVGGGAMVIAYAETLLDQKINYQQKLHVTAVDVSNTAAYMSYIQFSLLHIPAIVHVGNTLSLEVRETFYTPAHIMGLWQYKLARRHADSEPPKEKQPEQEIKPVAPMNEPVQAELF